MSQILFLTSPTFILIIFGFLTVRLTWMPKEYIKALAWFIVNIALPAALFKALSAQPFHEILNVDYLLVFGCGSVFAFLLLFSIAKLRNKTTTESALFGLGASVSNSLMIGFPIIMQLFGEEALIPFALALIIENLVILPLTLTLAQSAQHKGQSFFSVFSKSLIQLVKNPIIIAISLGVLCASTEIESPLIITEVIDVLSKTVAGISLFAIGGMLVGLEVKGMFKDISIIVIGKLIIHLLCVFAFIFLFPTMPPLYKQVAIILACMPMFSIYAVIGMKYQLGKLCSAVLLPTTVCCFITINVVIWLVSHLK